METVFIDHFLTNLDGSIEVGFHLNDQPVATHSQIFPSYEGMIADNQNVFSTNEAALKLALASWLGVDPTGGNQSLATDFRIEVDMTALVSVRRVLDV